MKGLLLVSPDGDAAVPLGDAERARFTTALEKAGLGPRDRVAVALSSDGELTGALWAQAAAGMCEAGAAVGPRGRLRLRHALATIGASALISTPTGAMDLLARLHLEFLLDPLDLGLRHIVLTGEIASPGTMPHLAGEFDASVTEVLAGPAGVPLGLRRAETDGLTELEPGLVKVADSGELIAGGEPTGLLARDDRSGAPIPWPRHTVGDRLLVRGRWFSRVRLARALSRIDGIATWDLAVSREGTLDQAVLTVTFIRESLVQNPMWRKRIEQAVAALTPVQIAVAVAEETSEEKTPGTVTDHRGQHQPSP